MKKKSITNLNKENRINREILWICTKWPHTKFPFTREIWKAQFVFKKANPHLSKCKIPNMNFKSMDLRIHFSSPHSQTNPQSGWFYEILSDLQLLTGFSTINKIYSLTMMHETQRQIMIMMTIFTIIMITIIMKIDHDNTMYFNLYEF
eukprot:TRINITY_DN28562_c2_g1_i1.p1 TRINITY_DN28562_c2_g1~~TRINITY_DN28562_c2_g1_i1.p1  ORF type:complete len:148 (-),score=7.17 TRINITY_DN28562_c2_g1_i1:686-1129(-)